MKYDFLCIEGNIGSGKTTLSTLLAKHVKARLLHETFEDNPFLPIFYQDPERYAFPVELHFMAERQKQLQHFFNTMDLFNEKTIADYCPEKSLLFAHNTLPNREFKLFKTIYDALFTSLRKADLIIYLHRDIQELQHLIRRRGRTFELSMSSEYLIEVHRAYHDYFKIQQKVPILWLNVNGVDFNNSNDDFETVCQLIEQDFTAGIHYYDLSVK
jgi:deoxyguanosine kinase